MTYLLFLIAALCLTADLFFIGSVSIFINGRIGARIVLILLIFPTIIFFSTSIGLSLGRLISPYLNQLSSWYSATLLFLLSLKFVYSGLKLHTLKQGINPISKSGIITFSITFLINGLFVGLAFGLLKMICNQSFILVIVALVTLFLGMLTGLKVKKLYTFRYDLLSALFLLLLSILIVLKK